MTGVFTKKFKVSPDELVSQKELAPVLVSPDLALWTYSHIVWLYVIPVCSQVMCLWLTYIVTSHLWLLREKANCRSEFLSFINIPGKFCVCCHLTSPVALGLSLKVDNCLSARTFTALWKEEHPQWYHKTVPMDQILIHFNADWTTIPAQ
jgi:hypothetical protein